MDDDGLVSDAVILAAGLGSRLGSMTQSMPKCMVEVGGQSILSRAFENLERVGVRRVVIVTGYLHDALEAHTRDLRPTFQIEFVHNADFATTNNIYSLWLAREAIVRDFYLLESDLVFHPSLLTDLPGPSAAAVSPLTEAMDGTVVTADSGGYIKNMYLKADARPAEPLLKTINIYRFSWADWNRILLPRFDEKIARGETNVYYELVFADAVRNGNLRLHAAVFPDEKWCEIDTPEDFARAQQLN